MRDIVKLKYLIKEASSKTNHLFPPGTVARGELQVTRIGTRFVTVIQYERQLRYRLEEFYKAMQDKNYFLGDICTGDMT